MWTYNTLLALSGTALLGLAAGVVGTFALLRRRALVGDALAHATLPGLWIAFVLAGREFWALLLGALLSGLVGMAAVTLLVRRTRVREDAAIGIVLSVFFGAGLVLAGRVQATHTDASQAGVESFLLGSSAAMIASDVQSLLVVTAVVLALALLLYKELALLCFDSSFMAVQGWPVVAIDFVLLLLLAGTTVIGLPAVGLVLVISLLIVPPAAARFWTDRLGTTLLLSGTFGVIGAATGTWLSSLAPRLPTGPIIVLTTSTIFFVSLLIAPRRGLVARARRHRGRVRRRIDRTILRALFEFDESASSATIGCARDAVREGHAWKPSELDRALGRLRRDGLVAIESDRVRLTETGSSRAQRLVRAHRLWTQYLLTHADIDRDLVDPDSDLIDSLLPTEIVSELEASLAREGRLPRASVS